MKQLRTRELLYDGMETQSLYCESHHFFGDCFDLREILRCEFAGLKSEIRQDACDKIISEAGFKSVSPFFSHPEQPENKFYHSQNGLPLYYIIRLNLLYVFSFGEIQPARYQLYCEGIWEMYVNHWAYL